MSLTNHVITYKTTSFSLTTISLNTIALNSPGQAINMHPTSSLFLSLLAATLIAAQLSPDINYCEGDKSTLGHCDTLTYEDTTLSAANPPTTTECQESCFSIFGDAGEWIVNLEGEPTPYLHSSPH
ncbi:hypothetical protein J4E81_006641 [Alternaria sp. BMP 2799]|nr:hypothetical protein J4E81_006641 [Alternaria sp. BMP 2799]